MISTWVGWLNFVTSAKVPVGFYLSTFVCSHTSTLILSPHFGLLLVKPFPSFTAGDIPEVRWRDLWVCLCIPLLELSQWCSPERWWEQCVPQHMKCKHTWNLLTPGCNNGCTPPRVETGLSKSMYVFFWLSSHYVLTICHWLACFPLGGPTAFLLMLTT